MTLIQGVYTPSSSSSRVVGCFVDKAVPSNTSDGPRIGYHATTIALDILLGFGAAIIVACFSRHRPFQPDPVPPILWAVASR